MDPRTETCPGCLRELVEGEQVYQCEVCDEECCTMCSNTTAEHVVICDDCLDERDDLAAEVHDG